MTALVVCPTPERCGARSHKVGSSAHRSCPSGQTRDVTPARFSPPRAYVDGREKVDGLMVREGLHHRDKWVTGGITGTGGGDVEDCHAVGAIVMIGGAVARRCHSEDNVVSTNGSLVEDCSSDGAIYLSNMGRVRFTKEAVPGQLVIFHGASVSGLEALMKKMPDSDFLDMEDPSVILIGEGDSEKRLMPWRKYVALNKSDPLWVDATNSELMQHVRDMGAVDEEARSVDEDALANALLMFPNPER